MLIPEKETAEAISNVAAACSLAPPLTAVCGATSIAAAGYASSTEGLDGNYRQAAIDIMPTVASETATLIFKRAEIVSDAVSTAIGVGTGFKTQYWNNRDNHIDNEGACEHTE